MAEDAGLNNKKRRFLIGATSVVGGIGVVAAAVPFAMSFWPSERAKAAGAPVDVDAAQARRKGRRPQIRRRSSASLREERGTFDQARDLRCDRHLHAPRLLSDVSAGSRAGGSRCGLARRVFLSLPPVQVRPRRPRVQKCARPDQSVYPAIQVPFRNPDRDRRRRHQEGVSES